LTLLRCWSDTRSLLPRISPVCSLYPPFVLLGSLSPPAGSPGISFARANPTTETRISDGIMESHLRNVYDNMLISPYIQFSSAKPLIPLHTIRENHVNQ